MRNQTENERDPNFPFGICPLQSRGEKKVPCGPECHLHRTGKGDFACVFHELAPIAFGVKYGNKRPGQQK